MRRRIGLMAREDRQRLSPRELLDGGIAALGAGALCAAFALPRIPRLPGESTVGSASQVAVAIGFVVPLLLVASAATLAAGRSRVAGVDWRWCSCCSLWVPGWELRWA